MRFRGRCAAVLTTILLVTLGPAAGAHAQPPAAPAAAASYAVTLVTGDRVIVTQGRDGVPTTAIQRGPGRDGMAFTTSGRGANLEVEPADAAPLVAAGTVDRRLFQVARLAAAGLDDKHAVDERLIVSAPTPGLHALRALPSLGAVVVREPKSAAGAVWRTVTAGAVAKVWLDGRSRVRDEQSNNQIGVPAARAQGLTGQGVTVAVLDTGYDATHPDLANVLGSQDFTHSPAGARDGHGHGTHVASILAGSGVASGGTYGGVAPDARLLVGKVCGDDGNCDDSAVIAGMEWATAQGAKVVNLSLGSGFGTDGSDPLAVAVNRLSAGGGPLFVCAAGNEGEAYAIESPASADSALAVGSVSRTDELSWFSSRGPRTTNEAVKPDLVAPGENIVAARAAGTSIGTPVGTQYTTLSGTSMATPHAAGAAALLAQRHPDWPADRLKTALVGSALPLSGVNVFGQGAGRLDIGRAATQTVYPTGGALSFGLQKWPYSARAPQSRTVTYRNDGTADVALSLDLSGPDGLLRLDRSTVTVPAHGTAGVTVTLTPALGTPSLLASARLTATGAGGVAVQTAIGATFEPESYDLTVKLIGRDGRPATGEQILWVVDGLGEGQLVKPGPDGVAVVRFRRGVVVLTAFIATGTARTLVHVPMSTVDKDRTVVLDARAGKRVTVKTDRANAVPLDVGLVMEPDGYEGAAKTFFVSGGTPVYAVPVRGGPGEFNFAVLANLESPPGVSPYGYHLAFGTEREIPTNLSYRAPHDGQLAAVRTTIAAQGAPARGQRFSGGQAGPDFGRYGIFHDITLPLRRTEYYSADPVQWLTQLLQRGADQPAQEDIDGLLTSNPVKYQGGKTVTEVWNRGVFGPELQTRYLSGNQVTRWQDELTVQVSLFAPTEPGHTSFPTIEQDYISGSTTLTRDGKPVASNTSPGLLDVNGLPPEPARYVLATTATRTPAWSRLSTRTDVAWTFTSAHVDGSEPLALPLLVVRTSGAFDDRNLAPAGTPFPLDLRVETQFGATVVTADRVTLQYSTDDGKTWKSASVSGSGNVRHVTVPNPGHGYVSLRMTASDKAGNRVEQTVIRAYGVR